MTPYVRLAAGASRRLGVLATVAAGLCVSWNGPLLIPAATRLQGIFFWDFFVYLLEGLVFLVTGLQLRILIERTDPVLLVRQLLSPFTRRRRIVVARFVWVFPATICHAGSAQRSRGAIRRRRGSGLSCSPLRRARRRLAGVGARRSVDHGSRFAHFRITILFCSSRSGDRRHSDRAGHRAVAIVHWLALPRGAEDERRRERGAELKARLETLNVAESELERLAADGDTEPHVLTLLRSRQDNRARQVPKDTDSKEAVAAALTLRADLINAERNYMYRSCRRGRSPTKPAAASSASSIWKRRRSRCPRRRGRSAAVERDGFAAPPHVGWVE